MNQKDQIVVLREEVLRWNRSFNLVSRQNAEERIDALIDECIMAGGTLLDVIGSLSLASCVQYVDLGTGGGFPGLVWHSLFSSQKTTVFSLSRSLLVEPRDKRAWFLQQAAQKMELTRVDVAQVRWGDYIVDSPTDEECGLMVVSMKALAMSDQDVLKGVSKTFPDYYGPCLIVRFISAADVVNKTEEMHEGMCGSLVDHLGWGNSSEYCMLHVDGKTQKTGLLLSWCP